ncbi:MAG: tyrosine-type recombinase/integrase [Candidatus Bathyarchaeia archaeon]
MPFIPTETEMEQLIAGCPHTKRLMAFLQFSKTGIRCGEACRLQWTDLNLERNATRISWKRAAAHECIKSPINS